ncbi:hypothetical protein BOM23_23025 [Erwinia sp. OLMDLW33]|nr:hypothetical protein BOM23_23025 [Erwinia sp. OLMDLW33]
MKSKLFLLQLLSFSSFAATDYCKDGTGLYVNVCFNDDLSAAVDDLQAEIDSQVSAESQSRADGDASTLSSANTYTDGKVTAESQSRADGDASTLSSANTYTDGKVTAESQSRADGDASTLSSANTYTDGKVTAESQSRADGDASTLSSANTYTNEVFSSFTADSNKKFESIDHKINKLSDRLNAAIAGSTAIASIPYVAEDSFSFGVGIGNYSNGNAVALGSQYKTSRNSNIRVNVSWDSTGNVASGAGFSAGW